MKLSIESFLRLIGWYRKKGIMIERMVSGKLFVKPIKEVK